MYLVESKGGVIACMLVSLFLLGTWPAMIALLERRGRLPQHTYLDYAITNLLAAVIIALTLGQFGSSTPEMPNFLTQLSQDNGPSVLFAVAGGVVLSIGNLATQYGLAYVGLSVTLVTTASIIVVIGTTVNYFLDDRINRAEILFPGVGCFLLAVCLKAAQGMKGLLNNGDLEHGKGGSTGTKAKFGTADFLLEVEKRRSLKVIEKSTLIGLAVNFFAGVTFSLFSPAINLATNDQWNTLKEGVPRLVVYTAFFYFSVSGFVIALILNITFLYRPVLGAPKSTLRGYLSDWNGRGLASFVGSGMVSSSWEANLQVMQLLMQFN